MEEKGNTEDTMIEAVETATNQPLSWQFLRTPDTPVKNTTMSSIELSGGSSCASYATCTDCSELRTCHWCDHDNACHAIGSPHGCWKSSACQESPPSPTPPSPSPGDDPSKNDTAGCYAHDSCSDCATASHLCHWCAHDNACHLKGSMYGCVNGVDCYSNDRCKRKEPEALYDHYIFSQMDPNQVIIAIVVGLLTWCCTTLCFCCSVRRSKDPYDYEDVDYEMHIRTAASASNRHPSSHEEALLPSSSTTVSESAQTRNPDDVSSDPVGTNDENDTAPQPVNTQGDSDNNVTTSEHLVQTEEGHSDEYVRLLDREEAVEYSSSSHRQPHTRTLFQRCLYCCCLSCYLISTFTIGAIVLGAIRFYPKIPQYNVCNDAVAWKSLIDNLAKMKVTADFELLASISNPNNFDVALDMGRGSFFHEKAFVGTFDIPPVTAKAMSITDMLIVAHLAPETWDALSLTKEYYEGKLVLHVNVEASVHIPAIVDISYTASVKDIVVHVNELADRHLCACPNWSDGNALSSTPHWLES